jgi:hypothetical protein
MRILSKAQEWTSGVNDAAASWSGLEAAPAFRSADEAEIQSREVDRRFDDATGLRAILFRKEGVEGAPGVYILEVEDLGSGNSARQVVAGIAGKWDLIERSVSLELKDHVCKGAVEIPEAEVAALGGECRLIPAIDTEDGSTVTATS